MSSEKKKKKKKPRSNYCIIAQLLVNTILPVMYDPDIALGVGLDERNSNFLGDISLRLV